MTRAEIAAIVLRAVDELDADIATNDRSVRHALVGQLLGLVDWRHMPRSVVRAVFELIIERAPVELLTTVWPEAPEGLAGAARAQLAWHEEARGIDAASVNASRPRVFEVIEALNVESLANLGLVGNFLRALAPNGYAKLVAELEAYAAIEHPTAEDDARHAAAIEALRAELRIEVAGPKGVAS